MRATGTCLATSAIRCCFVETSDRLGLPIVFPSSSPVLRRPLRSTGSFGSVPPLPRYYWTLRLPISRLPQLRCLRPEIPPMRLLFAPRRIDAPRRRAGVVSFCGFPNHTSVSGKDGTSQVPGEPQCPHAPLFDPGGTLKSGHFGSRILPSANWTASASTFVLFRGSITRPACSLSTLRSRGYPRTTQDSVPAAGQLYRRSLVTPWVPSQGFSLATSPPPRPSFAWRT